MNEPQTTVAPPPRHRRRNGGLVALVILAFLGVAGLAKLDGANRPRLRAGPLVQIAGPNEMAVVWSAATSSELDGYLRFMKSSGGEEFAARRNAGGYYVARFPAGVSPPGYEIGNTGFLGRRHKLYRELVRYPCSPGTAFRFLAFGDSGNGSYTQENLAAAMVAAKPELVIHTGDLIYPNGAAEDYRRNFFVPYRDLISRVAFMPSLGNHDIASNQGKPLLDVFELPQNGPPGVEPERNYWFDFGDARFVALDTNRSVENGAISESDMRDRVAPWLRETLRSSNATWKFVFFHHPPYTGSSHPAEAQAFVKQIFVPVFDECGVDVVFCGHNHLYERSHPIRHDRVVPDGEGTIYLTTGAGGVSLYPEMDPPPPYIAAFNDETFSFTQVDVSAQGLAIQQLDEKGAVIDRFALKPSAEPASPQAAAQ